MARSRIRLIGENDLKQLWEANAAETRRHFDATVQRAKKIMDASVTELRRHFEVTAEAS